MIPLLFLAAALECVHVTPGHMDSPGPGACGDVAGYEKLVQPGVEYRPDIATATRAPWLTSNGARILRANKPVFYQAAKGRAELCAAETFAFGKEALIAVDPADLDRLGELLRFLKQVDAAPLAVRANIGFLDDGSASAAEDMNLLLRRNLLFRIVKAPDPSLDLNVRPDPAANPSEFAAKVRQQLTDEKRLLRLYGSEVVIGRLTGDRTHARLHLLNYSSRKVEGLRIRILGVYKNARLSAPGAPPPLADFAAADGATEFSVQALETYAVIDLD